MVADREAILKVTVGPVPPQTHVEINMRKAPQDSLHHTASKREKTSNLFSARTIPQGRPLQRPTLSTVVHHVIGPPHQSPTREMATEAISCQELRALAMLPDL